MKLDRLQSELSDLQSKTIGLFIFLGEIDLVIEETEDTLTTIHITKLGGMVITHIPQHRGLFVRFPDGKTLSQMLDEPMKFHDWYKKNTVLKLDHSNN